MMRALWWGAGLAILAVVAVVGLAYAGILTLPTQAAPAEVLVIATAPDAEGAEVAAFAFIINTESDEASVLDTMRPVTVAGTSARNAREAFPYVGANGVADALSEQTGGQALPWIVVPRDVWTEVVDASGGLVVEVDAPISTYTDGALAVLEPGKNKLDGAGIAAVSAGVGDIEENERVTVNTQLTSGISAAFAVDKRLLAGYVVQGRATTSLTEENLRRFSAR